MCWYQSHSSIGLTGSSMLQSSSSIITTHFTTHLQCPIPSLVCSLQLTFSIQTFDSGIINTDVWITTVLLCDAAGLATPLEHLVMGVVMGVPILGSLLMGASSVGLVYGYVLLFDFLRCMGYSNVEVFPSWIFESIPLLRYIIYTPT